MLYLILIFATAICVHGKIYNLPFPIDLSHVLDEKTPSWYSNFIFQLTERMRVEEPFYAANNFVGAEHMGTHLDAPYHFNKNGWKTADMPLRHLIAKGIMIDVREKAKRNPDFELLPLHLEEWEVIYGKIPNDVIMLVNFGWASKYGNRSAYFGNHDPPYSFPGISPKAAEWIVRSGKIFGVGVDTPSLDFGKSKNFETHRILTAKNVYGIENVALNVADLRVKGFDVIVMPMKIKEGTGGPCRVVVF